MLGAINSGSCGKSGVAGGWKNSLIYQKQVAQLQAILKAVANSHNKLILRLDCWYGLKSCAVVFSKVKMGMAL